jgi:hypothetical protein
MTDRKGITLYTLHNITGVFVTARKAFKELLVIGIFGSLVVIA